MRGERQKKFLTVSMQGDILIKSLEAMELFSEN